VSGAASSRAELLKVSPFLPPQSAQNAPTPNAQLEYRGIMQMGDVQQYRVVDTTRKVGTWLKVGERDANLDLVIKQHDATNESVTVERGGQTLTLPIKSAKIISSGNAMALMPPPAPMPPPGSNVSPAVISTVVPNPTPADEQRRLEAVAAEVARRRAMREQAYQQQTAQAQAQAQAQGVPPQPMVSRQDMMQVQQPVPPAQRPNRTGR
jgi:hypothetical protein